MTPGFLAVEGGGWRSHALEQFSLNLEHVVEEAGR